MLVQVTHTDRNGQQAASEEIVATVEELNTMVAASWVDRQETLLFVCAELDFSYELVGRP